MKKSNTLILALVAATLLPALPPSVVLAQESESTTIEQRKDLTALTQSQQTAVKALVMAAIVDSQVSDLVQVDDKMSKKYYSLRNSYIGAVPMSGLGGLATYLGTESLRKVEFILKPLTSILRAGWEASKWVGKQVSSVLEAIHFDRALEISSDGSRKSWDIIQPVVTFFIRKETALSSGSILTGGIFSGSVYFTMHDSKEAMTATAVRDLLGQDDVIRSRVDNLVATIAPVVNMNPSDQAKLKILIYDNVLEQAVKNKFSSRPELYSLDVIELMSKNNLADKNSVEGLKMLRQLAKEIRIQPGQKVTAREIVVENVDATLGIAAVVEAQIESGNVKDPKTLQTLKDMLADIHVNLKLIGFNFKK